LDDIARIKKLRDRVLEAIACGTAAPHADAVVRELDREIHDQTKAFAKKGFNILETLQFSEIVCSVVGGGLLVHPSLP
jgi:hypothetical protein